MKLVCAVSENWNIRDVEHESIFSVKGKGAVRIAGGGRKPDKSGTFGSITRNSAALQGDSRCSDVIVRRHKLFHIKT
jgi:hypothetical protein